MATASRINKRPKQVIKLPKSHDDWHRLMLGALDAAAKSQDRRQNAMRVALASGKTEQYLRKIGVICQADIQREFPPQA
jgi:hypothetical protein